jgi:negative regulator of replication initiation
VPPIAQAADTIVASASDLKRRLLEAVAASSHAEPQSQGQAHVL